MAKNIIVRHPDGTSFAIEKRSECTFIASCTQSVDANNEDCVDMVVRSSVPVDFLIGDRIVVFGRPYWLNQTAKIVKNGDAQYEYSLHMEGVQYQLARAAYNVNIDTTGSDLHSSSLTADLKRFMQVLIANIDRVIPGMFSIGSIPADTETKTMTFGDNDNCLSVLQRLCDEYDTDFLLLPTTPEKFTINIGVKGRTFPFTFRFGYDRGIYLLTREKVSDANIVNRLMVYGSSRNVTHKYRAMRLLLPGKAESESFIEDLESIKRFGVWENSKTFDDIYPRRTGYVKEVVSGSHLEFIDTTMDFDLNDKESDGKTTKWLIPGTSAKVHFNTGNLAGMEFDIVSYDHATKKIKILPFTDENGYTFPSETSPAFQFDVNDEYVFIDINLPDQYVTNAENKLLESATSYIKKNSSPKVKYSLSVSRMFIEKIMSKNIESDVFWPGDMIPIQDAEIEVDRLIRVTGFKRDVLNPADYQLTIADGHYQRTIVNNIVNDLIDHDHIIEINNLKDPAKARRNWRDAQEVLNMVFDPEGDYYTEKIKPQSIDTVMLSVGAKSMQFGIEKTVFEPNFGGNANRINISDGFLVHYTIDEKAARRWNLAGMRNALLSGNAPGLTTDETAFYIYAKCQVHGNEGSIVLLPEPVAFNQDPLYYHFWIGVLNSVDPGLKVRSISLTYGFTTINGRFIKTGVIMSADGSTYFDLDNSEIGGRIVFTQNGQKKTLAELGIESLENKNFITTTLPELLGSMNDQIDGKIESWFQSNDPSVSWSDVATRKKHIGDMWYNTTTKELKRYSSAYAWERVEDKDAISAYDAASKAQDTADGKRRVFTSQPYPPYDKGDLWTQGSGGDLMVCNVSKASGVFVSSDWIKATSYTGDENLNKFINDVYNKTISDIYNQLDGVIESWFGNGVPTLSNYPASNWPAAIDKEKHLGDIFYNNDTGVGYRFSKDGSVYKWLEIKDAVSAQALAAASKAQDTADGKRRVFVNQPFPPYDVGDLWASGTFLKRCNVAKTSSQSYAASDWGDATKYTGDENLNKFIDGVFATKMSDIYNQLDGKMESFYTSTNPASNWKTDDVRKKHVGDMWYNTSANTLHRYTVSGSNYIWSEIKNADAIAAAAAASKAQDTADGKRRVFVSQPYTPYDIGDLWTQGGSGELMVCKTSRASGSYVSSDWGKATKYTDNSALNDFVNNTYNNKITEITKQIDGKIETWFQEANPWNQWSAGTEYKHVGDLWFNTATKELKRYNGTDNTNTWVKIEDQKAIDAYNMASQAKDTADGKRRVFVDRPYPPYDIGDLWVDGKVLRRSIHTRTSGSYMINDWVLAVEYDNTKTVIDGGIVTSGTIQVAGDTRSILAGITGEGTAASSVRFWAGASFENRGTAPFRVLQDGTCHMSKANVSGVVNAYEGTIGGFLIKPGMIGYGTTSQTDTTQGLCLTNDFVRFRDDTHTIMIGCLNRLGHPYDAYFHLRGDMGNTVEITRECTEIDEYWSKPKALQVVGNQLNLGKTAFFNTGYIGKAYTDILETWMHVTHTFLFNAIDGYLNVRLPKIWTVRSTAGVTNKNNMFIVCIQIAYLGNKNRIRISGVDGGFLVDNNGNRYNGGYGYLDMAQGDSLILMACGNDYFIMQYRI